MKENRVDVFAVLLTALKTNRVKDCLPTCSFHGVLSGGQHPGASMKALLPKNFWMLLTGCVEFGLVLNRSLGFPGGTEVKIPPANAGDAERPKFSPWAGKIPLE